MWIETLLIKINLLYGCRMKCPLGSTNKRFLLNTLRPFAAERRSGSRSATARGTEDSKEEGDRWSRHHHHHPEDREHGYRKDDKHRRERPRLHLRVSRPHDSSTSQLASMDRTHPHKSQSNGTRSRSPIRECPTTKKKTLTELENDN